MSVPEIELHHFKLLQMLNEEKKVEPTSENGNSIKLPVSRRAWLFQGTNEQKFPITIYVSAVDRESAIAHFETDYPQYNWFATVECPLLCG